MCKIIYIYIYIYDYNYVYIYWIIYIYTELYIYWYTYTYIQWWLVDKDMIYYCQKTNSEEFFSPWFPGGWDWCFGIVGGGGARGDNPFSKWVHVRSEIPKHQAQDHQVIYGWPLLHHILWVGTCGVNKSALLLVCLPTFVSHVFCWTICHVTVGADDPHWWNHHPVSHGLLYNVIWSPCVPYIITIHLK